MTISSMFFNGNFSLPNVCLKNSC